MNFNLNEANENVGSICDLIEQMNAPNPLNPAGISDLAYHGVMTGLHDESWLKESFV